MAKKHRKEKKEHPLTKRQLSKWEKQRRTSHIIIIASIVFVIVLLGLIGFGYYSEQVMPYHKIVIKVNDAAFDMNYYISALDAYTRGQEADMVKYFSSIVVQAIQQGELVRQGASAIGISVADSEIDNQIGTLKLPKNKATYDMVKATLLSQKFVEQYCLPKQPKSVEQVEIQAMFLESKKMAAERKQRLLAGDNFTSMAGMLSLDPVTQSKGGYLGWIPKGYEDYALQGLNAPAFKDVIFTMQPKEISDPIYDPNMEKQFGYWVLELLEKDDTKGVHARGILVATMDEAEEVRTKLQSGESFETLAKQYSQHSSKDQGGDLGWVVPGMEKGMLDRIIAALKPNEISEVIRDESVKTKGGWWVVQVMDKQADRPLDEAIRKNLADECLGEWINEQAKNAKIDVQMDQAQIDWAINRVIKNRG